MGGEAGEVPGFRIREAMRGFVVVRNRREHAFALAAAQDVAVEAPQVEVESMMKESATRAGPSRLDGGVARHRPGSLSQKQVLGNPAKPYTITLSFQSRQTIAVLLLHNSGTVLW
jgi:hypothetical protein